VGVVVCSSRGTEAALWMLVAVIGGGYSGCGGYGGCGGCGGCGE